MNPLDPFAKDIAKYLANVSSGRFTFGIGSSSLKIGELEKGKDGVAIRQVPTVPPDKETAIEYYQLDFWAINSGELLGYEDLRFIYNIFHRNHHYSTNNFFVQYSECTENIADMDRDSEGRKVWKLSVLFIVQNLIS